MKRYSHLYEQIIDYDNCRKAIIDASKHKRNKSYVIEVLENIDYYTRDLQYRLVNHKFVSPYRNKIIEDGLSHKKRNIQIPKFYPDQCAHHALINILEPIITKSSYYYSCANIPKRGIDYCLKAMHRFTKNESKAKYCAKLDIKHFYPSVDNNVLKKRLNEIIKDKKALNLIFTVIDTSKGLPIGNYTSPWFAEVLLQPMDNYIKQELKVPYYVRYADDLVLLSKNKRKLKNQMLKLITFVKDSLNLEINSNYQLFKIYNNGKGRRIDFVGKCFGIGHVTIRKRRALRIMKQSRVIQKMQENDAEISYLMASSFISRISVVNHCNCLSFKEKYVCSVNVKELKRIISKHDKKTQKQICNLFGHLMV